MAPLVGICRVEYIYMYIYIYIYIYDIVIRIHMIIVYVILSKLKVVSFFLSVNFSTRRSLYIFLLYMDRGLTVLSSRIEGWQLRLGDHIAAYTYSYHSKTNRFD